MSLLLALARGAAGVNALVLVALGAVWVRNYRSHGAAHTLGLVVFAALLFVQNVVWLYLYVLHPGFVGWFVGATADVRVGVTLLCGLETGALAVLARVTWR